MRRAANNHGGTAARARVQHETTTHPGLFLGVVVNVDGVACLLPGCLAVDLVRLPLVGAVDLRQAQPTTGWGGAWVLPVKAAAGACMRNARAVRRHVGAEGSRDPTDLRERQLGQPALHRDVWLHLGQVRRDDHLLDGLAL